jgi:hypothetical protein
MTNNKRGRPRPDPSTLRINPLLKETFGLIDSGGFNVTDIELAAGLGYRTMSRWMKQNGARLDSVEAVLNVMGYSLEIKHHEHISPECVSAKVGKLSVR